MKRVVIAEGPEDLEALHEIGRRFFAAEGGPQKPGMTVLSSPTGHLIELRHVKKGQEGDSNVGRLVGIELGGLPAQVPDDPTNCQLLVAVLDPDEHSSAARRRQVADAIKQFGRGWSLDESTAPWTATRVQGQLTETVRILVLCWELREEILDGLPDEQNLERVLDGVARRTHPEAARDIAAWLETTSRLRDGAKPTWKACMHAWASVLTPKHEPERPAIARRFFGQDKALRLAAEQVIDATGLRTTLAPLFE